jgi:hypothetical protein
MSLHGRVLLNEMKHENVQVLQDISVLWELVYHLQGVNQYEKMQ